MTHASPLRYPGGKASFSHLLAEIIELNRLGSCCMVEPYCGGAGASLELLQLGYVDRVILNDLDPDISAFWISVLDYNSEFITLVTSTSPTPCEWSRQRKILNCPSSSTLERGFATFFLNRCNRSGIIRGAGMIGGSKQSGKWKLDARYNADQLASRIDDIGGMRERIAFSSYDGVELLKLADSHAAKSESESVFCFIDPPYVVQGHTLYMNSMSEDDHLDLSSYLHSSPSFKWILTYDNCELIDELYSDFFPHPIGVRYSMNKRTMGSELMINDPSLVLPNRQRSRKISI